jgi:predicted amidohydrolase YtcJ
MHLVIMLREGHVEEAARRAAGQKGMPNPRVRYGPIKVFHGNRPQRQLNEVVLQIHEAGLQVCTHANGDREIDMVLAAYENAVRARPRADHRHRIEHCSVVTAELLGRIKKLGVVVAPHSYEVEHGRNMEAYGAERWGWMHANRSMIEMGIPVAANSDFPVSAADPLMRIESTVTRRCDADGKVYGAKQRTSAEQALAAWTRGGAFAAFEENVRGSLEPGKQADFVILSADPTTVAARAIRTIEVEATVVGGRVVAGKAPW